MKYVFTLLSMIVLFNISQADAQAKKGPVKKKPSKTSTKKMPVPRASVKASDINTSSVDATRVKIWTDSGTIVVKLYDSTPLHKANFIKLVKQGFYDSLLFHRVIPGFMVQGGDPTSKHAESGAMLGGGGGDMPRIPAEFNKSLIHKKGALAAARDNNPERASSACQFYLVEGKIMTDNELDGIEMRLGTKYSEAQRNVYKTMGGTPFLDMNYTVFGEVTQGMDVIHKIAGVDRDGANRPVGNIRMKMEIIQQ